jgi:threonine dehydratase
MANEGWKDDPESFIHPFADPEVQAGHGGAGLELLDDVPDLARVLVPVGGGGLIGGIASALKRSRPEIEVIGVQSSGYAPWEAAFRSGKPVVVKPETIADGTAGPVEPRMIELLKGCVDSFVTVPEQRLLTAIPELASRAKVVAEGAGALAYAALEQLPPGPSTVAVISGGNIDAQRLAGLLART